MNSNEPTGQHGPAAAELNWSARLHSGVLWLALALTAVAPFAYGSYPPWIAAFLVSALCVLGLAHVLLSLCRRVEIFPVGRGLRLSCYALLAWLCAMVLYDVMAGLEHGRTPALSVRELPYACAFFSAGLLGANLKLRQRRVLYWVLASAGALLAVLALTQWLGWDVKTLKASAPQDTVRSAGIYISPNRLAVMLSLCLSAALALFFSRQADPEREFSESPRRRMLSQILLLVFLALSSSGLVLTLSRLTIFGFGICLGLTAWVWTREYRRRRGEGGWQLSLAERLQRGILFGAPLLVVLAWTAWALSFGGQNLNERIHAGAETLERLNALRVSPPLLTAHPWLGFGLGGFEAAFTAVQNVTLGGRWTRLHNDWLQLAIECGWPALVLALSITAFWICGWWRGLRTLEGSGSSIPPEWLNMLLPMSGCATVLLCTGGDFPLREPSIACAFFMLAGLLGQKPEQRPEGAGINPGSRSTFALILCGVPLAAVLGWSVFVAGRSGLACAQSPWLGQIYFPPRAGHDLDAWQRAIGIDPGDPQYHYYLALAATQTPHAPDSVYERGLREAVAAEALSPREYLTEWTAFTLAEKLGRLDQAEEFLNRAIALFPQDPRMRQDRAIFFLRRWVEPLQPGSFRRTEGLQRALAEFHWLLAHKQASEEQLKAWLIGAGCMFDEVALLWEGDGLHALVSKAKYVAEQGEWDAADRELKSLNLPPHEAGTWDGIWYHTLSGTLTFQKSEVQAGIGHWGQALAFVPAQNAAEQQGLNWDKQQAAEFMRQMLPGMPPGRIEALAGALGAQLKEYPALAYQLALQLQQAGKYFRAEQLLRESGARSDELYRLRARNALLMDDVPAAREFADYALRFADPASGIQKWYADFVVEVEERRRRRKEQGH